MISLKKLFIITLFIITSFSIKAQVTFGGKTDVTDEEFANFKNTITLFSIQYKDYQELEKFNQAIASVWTITPFLIVKPEELGKYTEKTGYSYCSFGGYLRRSGNTTAVQFYYTLKMPTFKKSGKKGSDVTLGSIIIYPDDKTIFKAIGDPLTFSRTEANEAQMIAYLYGDATLYNWSAGLLKAYLKNLNDGLLSRKEQKYSFEIENKLKLSALAKDTLYVPDYVNVKYDMFKKVDIKDDEKGESLMAAYSLPIKFISTKTLNEMILKKGSNINYLVYTKSVTDKVVSIYNSASNELIYQNLTSLSFFFRGNDLKKIRQLIK